MSSGLNFSLTPAQAMSLLLSADGMKPYTLDTARQAEQKNGTYTNDDALKQWLTFPERLNNPWGIAYKHQVGSDSFDFTAGILGAKDKYIDTNEVDLAASQLGYDHEVWMQKHDYEAAATADPKNATKIMSDFEKQFKTKPDVNNSPISEQDASQARNFLSYTSKDLRDQNPALFTVKDGKISTDTLNADLTRLAGSDGKITDEDFEQTITKKANSQNPTPPSSTPPSSDTASPKAVSKFEGGNYKVDKQGIWTVGSGETAEQFSRQYLKTYFKEQGKKGAPTQEQVKAGAKALMNSPADKSTPKLTYKTAPQMQAGSKYDSNAIKKSLDKPATKPATEKPAAAPPQPSDTQSTKQQDKQRTV